MLRCLVYLLFCPYSPIPERAGSLPEFLEVPRHTPDVYLTLTITRRTDSQQLLAE